MVTVGGNTEILVASGYRVTNISVFPPTVTIFSADPKLVDEIPGYVETKALDLNGAKDDLDLRLPLDLPPGVSVVGEQTVAVQVGIAAIEGSLTLSDKQVEVIGLPNIYQVRTSPETVDVILSGPLPLLDQLITTDVRVIIDLTGEAVGTFQRVPSVEIDLPDIRVESILPGSIEVVVTRRSP
jgi:YbbR domain-containing protein